MSVVEVPLGSVRLKVGLARGRVGHTEPLSAIAERYGAVAAINGCFFDAYSNRPIKNPYHTLITDGEIVHLARVGSMLGVCSDGQVRIGRVSMRIQGGLDGKYQWPNNWYAYWINRYPEAESTATIFTRRWARETTPSGGVQIVVRDGRVVSVGEGPYYIPRDGFVLYLRGREKSLAERFAVGRQCEYHVVMENNNGGDFWGEVTEALGCGPMLVQSGEVVVNPTEEGFRHPKILSMACPRSAVGVTGDGHLLLVTCSTATIRNLARVMRSLGCEEAMNLDGGASSGLWVQGQYLTRPGRPVANALLILER